MTQQTPLPMGVTFLYSLPSPAVPALHDRCNTVLLLVVLLVRFLYLPILMFIYQALKLNIIWPSFLQSFFRSFLCYLYASKYCRIQYIYNRHLICCTFYTLSPLLLCFAIVFIPISILFLLHQSWVLLLLHFGTWVADLIHIHSNLSYYWVRVDWIKVFRNRLIQIRYPTPWHNVLYERKLWL